MQKKLIALAIAGLSGAAFAQSNVTIYGVMDATYDNVSASGATGTVSTPSRGRTTMNSSYIGFKGTEALGNGLAVAWQIESAVNENNGAGGVGAVSPSFAGLATRDSYVGLAGGFGTIAAGVLTGPTRALGAAMDVNSGATGIGANTALLGKLGGGNGAGAFDQRINNAIAYISPNMSGFSAVVGYLPNENRGSDAAQTAAKAAAAAGTCTSPTAVGGVLTCPAVGAVTQANTSGWTFGLNYNNGPIMAGFAYTGLKDANANSTGSAWAATNGPLAGTPLEKASDTRFAFKYDFGAGTVGVLWDKTKANAAALGDPDVNQTVWYLPVTFNVGAGKVIAQYGHANNLSGSAVGAGADFAAKHFELGYEYSLSKRTILKAIYSKITNNTTAQYDFLYGVSAPNTTTAGAGVNAGSDPSGISFGVRHSF